MIMQARVIAGWITEADLAKKAEPAEASEDQPVYAVATKRTRSAPRPCADEKADVTGMLGNATPISTTAADRQVRDDADVRGHPRRCARSTS